MTQPRPESEVYRDGFCDGLASARRAVQLVEETLGVIGIPVANDARGSLRGIRDALDWALQSSNTDQAIAHWKAVQEKNT